MDAITTIVDGFTFLSYGGLALCSVVLFAALLERVLFWLFVARRVATEGSALGLYESFRWVGAVAPLLGILGTVAGIMLSFRGAGLEPDKLLSGISVSLWTTGLGLLAAILAVTLRQLFVGVTERALARLEEQP